MQIKVSLIAVALLVLGSLGALHLFLLDGLQGLLFDLLTEEVTYYASGTLIGAFDKYELA